MCTLSAPALSNNVLVNSRWLIGDSPKDNRARQSHLWASILTVNEGKQCFFLERIFFLHEIAVRRSQGKTTGLRLTQQEWDAECDRYCLLASVLQQMESALDPKGNRLFSDEVMRSLVRRGIEGPLA